VQAHAKHQQHHANFRQLRGNVHIGHKTRRGRANHNAGQQVAHQGWQAQLFGEEAKHQRPAKSGSDGGDQGQVVVHAWWKVWVSQQRGEAAENPGAMAGSQARHNVGAVSSKAASVPTVLLWQGLHRVASRCVRAILGAQQRAA